MQTAMKWLGVLVLASGLIGCGSMGTKSDDSGPAGVEDRSGAAGMEGTEGYGADTSGLGAGEGLSSTAFDDPASPLSRRTIFFEFDSAEVRAEDREALAAHATYLANNPMSSVTLEGHADERGSREYNIGLGDRRAQAVRRLLEFQGASPSQINTVSYGEEKPAVEGHDEAAWSQNRRVEILYSGQ